MAHILFETLDTFSIIYFHLRERTTLYFIGHDSKCNNLPEDENKRL